MKIYTVNDKEFEPFGKVLNIDTKEIIDAALEKSMPEEGSVYEASVTEFESLDIFNILQENYFGEIPMQLGYCYGHSHKLNALEWHKCSEINVAVTDLILLLGKLSDIKDNRYDSKNVIAFKLLKGQAIEVYATTLHFCPIETENTGFGCVVGLIKGTNTNLEKIPSDKLLFRKNKWLIAHEQNEDLIRKGVVAGIYGPNHTL